MKSPHDLLPVLEPKEHSPPPGYFYENVIRPLIPDIVRIMLNGIPMDLEKVDELREVVEDVLETVQSTLDKNKTIRAFQAQKFPKERNKFIAEMKSKMKPLEHFLKEFKDSNKIHRTYIINAYLSENDLQQYHLDEWLVKDVKDLIKMLKQPILELVSELETPQPTFFDDVLAKKLTPAQTENGMYRLAMDKQTIYNKTYHDKIANVVLTDLVRPFNAGSSDQKNELFEYLGIKSEKLGKAYIDYQRECKDAERKGYSSSGIEPPKNMYSWDRDQVERVNKETHDDSIKELTQMFIDHSFSAIIRNNFIAAFDRYVIDDVLYGNLKLGGAKSFRLTSNNPNMLNLPSSASIYAKPLKKCLIAPEGFVIYAIDFSALEDRVIASIAKDENKCNIFLEGLDGHCLNAAGYFKEEIEDILGSNDGSPEYIKKFFEEVENGNKDLKAIRQKGKGPTFGLAYGAYPPKIAATLKISLEEAEVIFNRYHNELYPDITKYREDYVLPTAKEHGSVHLGLGLHLKTDDPKKDIRTLANATIQFWSILTLLAINKMHEEIDSQSYEEDIFCIATIYDSAYYVVRDDAETIKWLNDTIVPIMNKDFLIDQIVHNEATGEIGPNWADLQQIPNEASLEQIQEVLDGR